MKLIRHLHNIKARHRGGVLTIGNFDGIHLGHQAMLRLLNELADKYQTHRTLMTFSPLPHEYFCRAAGNTQPPARLMNLREKVTALSQLEAELTPDYLLLTQFNTAFASMPADAFIKTVLVDRLAAKAVAIGDDFHFGQHRAGDLDLLRYAADKYGFEVVALSTHNVDNTRVSSTRIRHALLDNDLDTAERMLGRPYYIEGRVTHGEKRGRTIGFPTANIHLHRPVTALHGVYAVTMTNAAGKQFAGIANLGKRPTVGGTRVQLEVHLFNFDENIYGQYVCVGFHKKIRDEIKFESFDALKQQIMQDCDIAKRFHEL